jgi:hypothetical protein
LGAGPGGGHQGLPPHEAEASRLVVEIWMPVLFMDHFATAVSTSWRRKLKRKPTPMAAE